ncbi:predicted protein [Naegleria gruberi]|uniref:Predicted protein n=1 Tax=Naegleria gruberi TaxID=5762 RepID=D2UZ53_NAEGR|nr:uncharacterized protein NAEGRDRAFT_61815 [Naegleria gruberi]EFC50093.1 predicted protein [Naegleria gruberi]|eukprot:XP_002682837.1 predicted protein [Naegleria gruberi strain NEG-M]
MSTLNIQSLFSSSAIINDNGYTNVTLDQFRPIWSSSLVLSNTILFLFLFTIYMFILIGFIYKVTRKLKLKRNQKILFIMTGIYVTVQIMSLLIRVVNESLQLTVRTRAENGGLIEWELFVTMQVFAGLNTFSMLSNFLTLFSIVIFVQNMFWSTATLMRAISKQTSKIIRMIMTIVGTVFVIVAVVIILLIGIIAGIRRFDYIPKEYVAAIQVTSFVVGGIVLLFVGGMLIASGIIVIRTIQKTSKNVVTANVSNNTNSESFAQKSESNIESQTSHSSNNTRQSFDKVSFEKRVQSPFKITFGLLIGLLMCISLQLIAIAIASGATELANYSVIWQFLNCTGVLTFGILILFLFFPLFRDMEIAMQEIEKRKEALSQKKLRSNHLHVPSTTRNHLSDLSGSGDNFLSLPSSSGGDMSPTSPSAISFSSEVMAISDDSKLYQ